MTLFFSLLPLYLLGNLHCLGMCGPLVVMIGHHRYRYYYFLGRAISFTFAGMLAGEAGALLTLGRSPAILLISFGAILMTLGLGRAFNLALPAPSFGRLNLYLSKLMLKDRPWPTLLFGLSTILLPCGQTIVVYATIATTGSALSGLLNGFAFALLTSPALFLALKASQLLNPAKKYYRPIFTSLILLTATLTLARGVRAYHNVSASESLQLSSIGPSD